MTLFTAMRYVKGFFRLYYEGVRFKSPYERLCFYHNDTFYYHLYKFKLKQYIYRNTPS